MPTLKLTPIRGTAKSLQAQEGAISIGRGAENSIPLIDERASRKHCIIELDKQGCWIVRDLNSRNGTKVNEAKVNAAILKPGDVLKVGSHEFLIEGDKPDIPELHAVEFNVDTAFEHSTVAKGKGLKASTEVGWMFELADVMNALPPKDSPVEDIRIIDANGNPTDVLTGTSDGPNAVRMLLQLGSKSRGTDIHLEPKPDSCNIRMRVDGDMVPILELPKRVGELVFGVVKAACHMHVAGRDAVQDGHFSTVFPDRRVEYRISFTPSMHGQKLVVRILDSRGQPTALGDLGMFNYMLDRIKQVCDQDSGLILACGPTGSGKTTTLYNAIREIDRTSRNVITIEDPVEYQLPGVTQIPVDEQKGNNFGSLLRSVLRQDPDVILVGEIRDEETARTAMQAALTGHLVFSSIHSKETITSVFRLLDLKVEPYLVANSLDLILAQRLVRVLCDHCKRLMPVTPGQSTRLGKYLQGKTQVHTATGCARCLRTGYRGRRALFELLDFNDELRDIVLKEPSITAMKKVIEQGLFSTLQQFGWRLVAEGVTSLDEVDRVAGMS